MKDFGNAPGAGSVINRMKYNFGWIIYTLIFIIIFVLGESEYKRITSYKNKSEVNNIHNKRNYGFVVNRGTDESAMTSFNGTNDFCRIIEHNFNKADKVDFFKIECDEYKSEQ